MLNIVYHSRGKKFTKMGKGKKAFTPAEDALIIELAQKSKLKGNLKWEEILTKLKENFPRSEDESVITTSTLRMRVAYLHRSAGRRQQRLNETLEETKKELKIAKRTRKKQEDEKNDLVMRLSELENRCADAEEKCATLEALKEQSHQDQQAIRDAEALKKQLEHEKRLVKLSLKTIGEAEQKADQAIAEAAAAVKKLQDIEGLKEKVKAAEAKAQAAQAEAEVAEAKIVQVAKKVKFNDEVHMGRDVEATANRVRDDFSLLKQKDLRGVRNVRDLHPTLKMLYVLVFAHENSKFQYYEPDGYADHAGSRDWDDMVTDFTRYRNSLCHPNYTSTCTSDRYQKCYDELMRRVIPLSDPSNTAEVMRNYSRNWADWRAINVVIPSCK